MVAPPVLGALAPDTARATPPSRPRGGAASVASLKRRESSWKDEVRERVQRRRRGKSPDLPLFDGVTPPEAPASASGRPAAEGREPEADVPEAPSEAPRARITAAVEPPEPAGPTLLGDEPLSADAQEPRLAFDTRPEAAPAADLPLRLSPPEMPPPLGEGPGEVGSHLDEAADADPGLEAEPEEDWAPRIEIPARPVERPAPFGDRFEAAAVDAGVLLAMYAIVVYFASRITQADPPALLAAWPWLLAYLAGLGLGYAAWFTGTTGQTPGKMLFGLRVVETDGQPPGYLRALGRAALGAVGSAALGLGAVPLFFDPARRAFHDRLLRTRVVKS